MVEIVKIFDFVLSREDMKTIGNAIRYKRLPEHCRTAARVKDGEEAILALEQNNIIYHYDSEDGTVAVSIRGVDARPKVIPAHKFFGLG